MFCPLRKWRSDFFHRPSNTLIEIEGGIWSGVGRHTSGKGYTSDALKYNVASYMGYRLFRLTSSLLTLEYVQDISKICLRQTPSEHFVLAKKQPSFLPVGSERQDEPRRILCLQLSQTFQFLFFLDLSSVQGVFESAVFVVPRDQRFESGLNTPREQSPLCSKGLLIIPLTSCSGGFCALYFLKVC